ncbi:MAG TPA: hypothetical protein DFI00_03415 [Rhodospirillaceae bacterium]|nr:hypothetical protein [Alphaproteobacteria bacterium]OUT42090.1 MAG: hypothetical protein CBB62_07260 [Micavibrio sp. TMED2]HCI46322.1 hypothetical protein [Rhodospirillaceae bacterium]MAS46299.1 hypothetical protein [Alphaproteobacteria bacterium]MAX95515.1 hypothetical protein [Alphaproteobacteria bacterium]|tara:strand:- start:1294 stop:3255 length:1962 start_codon:yes stop_codon:yes gene_type:complete
MSDPNNHDEFEDDDLEPVWASPDDAEDDWDDGFDDDADFADDGDEFEASADDDAPFDDEYESEFSDDGTAEASDDFDDDDEGFDEDFGGYDDDDEGFEGGEYDDEGDEYEDEDGELAADGAAQRSAVQKYLPYGLMGGFGLFVLYMGYTIVLGGGGAPPPPAQRLPLTPPQQTAQNNTPAPNNPAPGLPGQANNTQQPLPMPGQPQSTDPGNVSVADLANMAGGNNPPPAGLGGMSPSNPTNVTPRPISDLASANPINTPMPTGQVQPNGGLGGIGTATPVQAANNAQSSMLGELGSIGTADPLGTGASGGLPSAGQLPQPNGIGLSGSLGLSTNNVNQPEPTGQPMGQMPAGTGTSNTGMGSQMPAGMAAVEGFVTEDDLASVANDLRGNLTAEIKNGMDSLKEDLRDSMQSVFEEEMVLIQGQINGLERRIAQLAEAQQDMATVAAARPQQPANVRPQQPAAAQPVEPVAEPDEMVDNQAPAPAEPSLEDQMNAALASVGVSGSEKATAAGNAESGNTQTAMSKVVSPEQGATRSTATSRPPAIRRSAAPTSAPPVPMQKPGYFMAEGLAPQPGPFGARLPVQMADMRGQPNGLYQLRGVSSGTAWVSSQDTGTVLTVNRGDFLPGLGRVTEIRRSFNGWEVVTERGIVRQ